MNELKTITLDGKTGRHDKYFAFDIAVSKELHSALKSDEVVPAALQDEYDSWLGRFMAHIVYESGVRGDGLDG